MGNSLIFKVMYSQPKVPLSVVIVARNEEKNIRECLDCVAFAEEIVVVDDFSEDATAEIARECGAKVFQRAMNGNWGAQETFAIQQATQDWILILDCDERVTPELKLAIEACISRGEKIAYQIKRINHFRCVPVNYGVLRPDFVARLMPREGTSVEGLVHQKVVFPYPTKKLSAPMLHFTYNDWGAYLRKFNQYTELAAQKAFDEGKRARFFRDILCRPAFAFFKMYFLHRGFLDGKIGWILSVNHYFYTLMKYVRLYFLASGKKA